MLQVILLQQKKTGGRSSSIQNSWMFLQQLGIFSDNFICSKTDLGSSNNSSSSSSSQQYPCSSSRRRVLLQSCRQYPCSSSSTAVGLQMLTQMPLPTYR